MRVRVPCVMDRSSSNMSGRRLRCFFGCRSPAPWARSGRPRTADRQDKGRMPGCREAAPEARDEPDRGRTAGGTGWAGCRTTAAVHLAVRPERRTIALAPGLRSRHRRDRREAEPRAPSCRGRSAPPCSKRRLRDCGSAPWPSDGNNRASMGLVNQRMKRLAGAEARTSSPSGRCRVASVRRAVAGTPAMNGNQVLNDA